MDVGVVGAWELARLTDIPASGVGVALMDFGQERKSTNTA